MKKFSLFAWLGHLRWCLCYLWFPILAAKFRYNRSIRRVKEKAKTGALRVLFVVGTSSKWKAQSLYDLMAKSKLFEPNIVLVICDSESKLSVPEKSCHIKQQRIFFESKGMRCFEAFNEQTGESVNLNVFRPDIVFYHQPWEVAPEHLPHCVAKTALTFYMPYYVSNYGDLEMDVNSPFQRSMFGFITLNKMWAETYYKFLRWRLHTCRFLPLGHTALDGYRFHVQHEKTSNYVVFAPHWSIPCEGNENSENYSTFLWSGNAVLEFAKQHREIKWVFKPHPTLQIVLRRTGVWSEAMIGAYWNEWEKLGKVCYDGSYYDLFNKARAMITDCGSFLVEFACTGNPIIHIVSDACKIVPLPVSAQLFDSYYKVHDKNELNKMLKEIVLDGRDNKRELRLERIRNAGLIGNNAANNIMVYLNEFLEIHE